MHLIMMPSQIHEWNHWFMIIHVVQARVPDQLREPFKVNNKMKTYASNNKLLSNSYKLQTPFNQCILHCGVTALLINVNRTVSMFVTWYIGILVEAKKKFLFQHRFADSKEKIYHWNRISFTSYIPLDGFVERTLNTYEYECKNTTNW